ncbi:NAD(P)/FAD-dependent oxidoreductase [bacterium]|nr:NAD(P)/FAD-dependent oxidoreductase [bacterium]MBU1882754.1 NAD(P)/FAD-dependent oxidoreductase [bacterium]
MKKIAIIGAGAAGLTAAIVLARKNIKVDIFEQNDKNAKKILVSGNGHCNITNKNIATSNYISENPQFIEYTLKQFGFHELEKFMNSIGLLLFSKNDGKTYPLSYEAKSVINAFEETLQNLNVTIHNAHRVESITKDETFTLTCKEESYEGYNGVIVATGLKAAPQLGGNDDGLKFAAAFGHTIIESYPSLVGLHLDSSVHESLSGVKINGEATIYIDRLKEKTVRGDILFTNYGFSGLAILDISQIASKALLNHQNVDISLNLMSNFNPQSLSAQISNLCKIVPQNSIYTVLSGIVPTKLALSVLKETNIQSSLKASDVNTKMVKGIVNKLQNWRFKVIDTHGYKHAEVCGGGVDTLEIDAKSFESKKLKGLYFIGEILDVIGERGGYNFQFAFASGFLCAQEIAKSK